MFQLEYCRSGKILLLEDAELKTTFDIVSLIESSDLVSTASGIKFEG